MMSTSVVPLHQGSAYSNVFGSKIASNASRHLAPSSAFFQRSPNDALRQATINSYIATLALYGSALSESLESIQSNLVLISNNEDDSSKSTADFQNKKLKSWEIQSLKSGLILNLQNHPLKPKSYKDSSEAFVFEFNKHRNHIVCVIDNDGIQILWSENSTSHSKFIPDQLLTITKLSNDFSKIIDSNTKV